MADEFKLDIFKRDNLSKSSLKQLRRDGNIPGIFYSYNSKESIPFYMGNKTLNEAKKSGARIFNIAVGSKKQTVIFKSVQYHPVTDEILHVDLYGVDMDKAVAIQVQLILEGNAKGVANEGGGLVQSLNEIEIECLPSDIPERTRVAGPVFAWSAMFLTIEWWSDVNHSEIWPTVIPTNKPIITEKKRPIGFSE